MAIHIKKKNVGKFTAYKKRTGKTTAEALHSKDPHVRQMANFARNAKKWKHPDGGTVEDMGSMLQMIPGVGTIFGTALKSIGGQMNQAKQMKQLLLQQQQVGGAIADQNQAGIMNAYAPTFAAGGITPDGTPLEVERGEVMRNPNDGSLAKISDSAPTHAQGGVDTSAEPGTQIYGKLKVKAGRFQGLTYKEAADKIKKQLAQLDKD